MSRIRRCSWAMLLLAMLLCACGDGPHPAAVPTPTVTPEVLSWQDQYDLGLRYLSEGSYEEAVLAFTAAIDIDPKRAEAYVGRGDAYVGWAGTLDPETQAAEISRYYENAEADYLTAIDLDALVAAVYSKLADLYLLLGNTDAALAILERGIEATEDEALAQKLQELKRPEGASDTVTVEGYIFSNHQAYSEMEQYIKNESEFYYFSSAGFGIYFSNPLEIEINNQMAIIQEAEYSSDIIAPITQLYNEETDTPGPLLEKTITMTGYFTKNEQTEVLSGPVYDEEGRAVYSYRPNGDYVFHIESYQEP